MTRNSLLKKIWNGRSKGVSTVVGTVFLMLIIFMVAANVLLWTFSQNAEYNEAVMEKNQEEADRRNENVVASIASYAVDGDMVTVEAELRNAGSVAAQIVNVWVLDTTTQKYGFVDGIGSLNLNLNPGDNITASAMVTIPGADESHTFNSWFVTARGNTIPLEEEQVIIVAHLSKGVGYLALDFDKFRHFTYESPQKLDDFPDGTLGFNVPRNEYVAFGCFVTNLDPAKRTITVDSHSLFFQPGRTGVGEGAWFIVEVNDDGTVNETFSTITLEYNEETMLVFASKFDLGLGSFDRVRTAQASATVITFLALHGTVGSTPYAQSIPYVSLFYS